MGHLNGFFAPTGGNLNKPIFKSSNARGVARGGGLLNFRIDRRIKRTLRISLCQTTEVVCFNGFLENFADAECKFSSHLNKVVFKRELQQ